MSGTTPPPAGPRILYVQTPGGVRPRFLSGRGATGWTGVLAVTPAEALGRLVDEPFVACLVDLSGGRGALTTARLLRARHPALPLVGIVDPAAPEVAAEAIHSGFADLMTSPLDEVEMAALVAEVCDREPAGVLATGRDGLVAVSPAMRQVMARARELAATHDGVYVIGAQGTGKVLVARVLHRASAGDAAPFVVVDAASRSSALETELFGASRSDRSNHPARLPETSAIVRAQGGTLVVRHLDEAPAHVQLRLARAFGGGDFPGGQGPDRPAVRLVATIRAAAAPGKLAPQVVPELAARLPSHIAVPELRKRREDVALLAVRRLQQADSTSRQSRRFSRAALELLAALPWPGNVPQLESTVGAILADAGRPVLQLADVLRHVRLDGSGAPGDGQGLRAAREAFERECIQAALVKHRGRVGEAARALGIQRTNLYRKVRQLGIPRTLLSSHR